MATRLRKVTYQLEFNSVNLSECIRCALVEIPSVGRGVADCESGKATGHLRIVDWTTPPVSFSVVAIHNERSFALLGQPALAK